MQTVLDGYAQFLREKDLALPKHQPCLVRWVREFLLFAQEHGGDVNPPDNVVGKRRTSRCRRRVDLCVNTPGEAVNRRKMKRPLGGRPSRRTWPHS